MPLVLVRSVGQEQGKAPAEGPPHTVTWKVIWAQASGTLLHPLPYSRMVKDSLYEAPRWGEQVHLDIPVLYVANSEPARDGGACKQADLIRCSA